MRVSVIIPTYNYGEFIGDALRSVEAQTLTDWECIVIDDASSDDTAAIVRTFVDRDARFRYLRMEQNGGVSKARNRGFAEARGTFIQMVDADDVIGPRKLEIQVAWMEQHPEVAVVYSDYMPFQDRPIVEGLGAYRIDEEISGSGDPIMARLLRSNIFRLNTVLFRVKILGDVGGFREGFRYVEDWDFWLRIAARGYRFHYLDAPEAMSGVRSNPRSLSTDKRSMHAHYLPVLQHLWAHGGLSFSNRVSLVLRYTVFLLDRIMLGRGKVIILEDRKAAFLCIIFIASLIVLPFWPFYKLRHLIFADWTGTAG